MSEGMEVVLNDWDSDSDITVGLTEIISGSLTWI